MDEFEKDLNEQQTPVPEAPAVPDEAPETNAQSGLSEEAPQADTAAEEAAADIPAQDDAAAEESANETAADIPETEAAAVEAVDAAAEPAEDAQGAETAQDAQAELSPTGEDALVQELEGIRDLLQQELDNAADGELIQGLDEIPEEPEEAEEIPEEERCQCCGERRRDTSFGEDYPYCAECRDLMKAAPIKWTSVLCWIVMLAVAAASLLVCAGSITDYATLMEAETYYANRQIVDAEATYYNYLSTAQYNDNHSRAAVRNLIDIFSSMGYLSDANDLITQNFTEAQLKLPWNKRYAAVAQEFKDISAASEKISTLLQDVMYAEDGFDFDEKSAALDKLTASAEDGTPGLPEIFVEYYRYVLMNLSKQKSDEEMIAQLQRIEALDDGSHAWLYLTNLLSLASKTGNEEMTRAYYDKVLEMNVQETTAYSAMANVYRFTETPDADKMLEITNKAEENMSESAVPTYLVERAIAYLFKDDAKSAMDAMETYMNSGSASGQAPYTVQSCNMYALCCVLTGDDDGYKQMEDVFASADMQISKLVRQFKQGKLELNDVLTDNGGDI